MRISCFFAHKFGIMKELGASEKILHALKKHKGIKKAVTAPELAAEAGVSERQMRRIISDFVKKQELLIASTVRKRHKGFYFIKEAGEVRQCLGQYKSRIDKLNERASSLYRAGAKRFGKAALRGFKFNGYPKLDLPINKKDG